MALGLSAANANAFLNWLCRATAMPTAPAGFFMKLHIGDPGAAGTANVAGNDTRKAVTFGSVAAGGLISNTVAVTWAVGDVDTAEDYSHYSIWDTVGPAGGVFQGSGLMTANAVLVGNEFVIPVGDVDLSFLVAA